MTDDMLPHFDLPAVRRKKLTGGFDGGSLSSDGEAGAWCWLYWMLLIKFRTISCMETLGRISGGGAVDDKASRVRTSGARDHARGGACGKGSVAGRMAEGSRGLIQNGIGRSCGPGVNRSEEGMERHNQKRYS
jgi:hypothetical protein